MQDTIEMIVELNRINAEVKEAERKRRDHLNMCALHLPSLLRTRLKDWDPQVGESIVMLSLENSIAFELILRERNGRNLRAQEGEKPCYHHIELDLPGDEYEIATFAIPIDLYQDLKQVLEVEFLSTYRHAGYTLPSWA